MEAAVIWTAIIINVVGVASMVYYAGRKVGTICTRLNTCSENISALTMQLNKLASRVQAVEIGVTAHTSVHRRTQGEP